MATCNPDPVAEQSTTMACRTAEYRAMTLCTKFLVNMLKESPNTIGSALFARGLLSPEAREYLTMESVPRSNKAEKIVECMTNRIKEDPQVFFTFIDVLEKEGPWADHIIKKLQECHEEQKMRSISESSSGRSESLSGRKISNASSEMSLSTTTKMATDIPHALSLPNISYIQFKCGCGECSVLKHIAGKICPNPQPLPIPKLRITDTPPGVVFDLDILEQTLAEESKKMHVTFCKLVFSTFKLLKITTEISDVIEYVETLLTPATHFPRIYTNSESVTGNLSNISTFAELRKYIQGNYCSWFNYELIAELRKYFLHTTEDRDLNAYEECFNAHVRSRSFMYNHDLAPDANPEEQLIIVCKVDFEYEKISFDQIKHLKLTFSRILGMSQYHLVLREIRSGCTELVFLSPMYVENVKSLLPQQLKDLQDRKFLQITIGKRRLLKQRRNEQVSVPEGGIVSEIGVESDDDSIEDDLEESPPSQLNNPGLLECIAASARAAVGPTGFNTWNIRGAIIGGVIGIYSWGHAKITGNYERTSVLLNKQ